MYIHDWTVSEIVLTNDIVRAPKNITQQKYTRRMKYMKPMSTIGSWHENRNNNGQQNSMISKKDEREGEREREHKPL